MIDQQGIFAQVAEFLGKASQNNHKLRTAIDRFTECLETCERASIMPGSGTPADRKSIELRRSAELAEFYRAVERFQISFIESNQALTVAASIAQSIADAQGLDHDRHDNPPAGT